jgi:hypothetical protein
MHVIFEAALTKERLAAVCSDGDASHLRKEALAVYEQLNAAPHVERLSAARRSAT